MHVVKLISLDGASLCQTADVVHRPIVVLRDKGNLVLALGVRRAEEVFIEFYTCLQYIQKLFIIDERQQFFTGVNPNTRHVIIMPLLIFELSCHN